MQKFTLNVLAVGLAVSLTSLTWAQSQHMPRGTATDVSKAEIDATVQKTATAPVSDQAMRVVSIANEYNVGVGVVHRAKTAGRDIGGGIEHSQIGRASCRDRVSVSVAVDRATDRTGAIE